MSKPTLRPYQQQDFEAVITAHQSYRRVFGRAATGLGKGYLISAVAEYYAQFGRVLVMVDVKKLVRQLAASIKAYTGTAPGVEMGEERAIHDDSFCQPDRIVVATVQTMYSGAEGKERYRQWNPMDYACVILDETELFLAPKSRSVVDYFYNGNPELKVFGTSATIRSDGIAMANLFDHVAFNRDIVWGIKNGYLVNMVQAFVRVSVDFSTLSVRKADGDDSDYSSEEIASRISNEETQIELAKGIVHVAENRKSIVVCPTVDTARAVAHYIDAQQPGSARCIYGMLGDEEKDDIFAAFHRDEFRYLTSVSLLCLDDQTEILTSGGWKGMNDISEIDEVANWKGGSVYFERPERVIRRPRGQHESMVSASGGRVNVRVTEGHNLIARSRGAKKFKKRPASDFVGKAIEFPVSGVAEPFDIAVEQDAQPSEKDVRRLVSAASFNLRKSEGLGFDESKIEAENRLGRKLKLRRKNPSELTLAECRFIGFWVGDGTCAKLSSGGLSYSCCQSIAYPKIIQWFDGVLVEMGIDFTRNEYLFPRAKADGNNPHIRWGMSRGTGSGPQSRDGIFHLEPYLKKNGTRLLWGLNCEQFAALIEGYWMADGRHGDGDAIPNRQLQFSDTKRPWLDLLQAIGAARGYRGVVRRGMKPAKPHHFQIYQLTLRKARFARITKTRLAKERGWRSEMVWCVQTSSGNIITRRHGQVMVMGNCKGFDEPGVSAVFNCRKTRSKRLYAQILGRGTRPLPGIVDGLETSEERLAAIAASAKPSGLMVNMVGVDSEVRDITILDILGEVQDEAVLSRAKKLIQDEEMDSDEALEQAAEEVEADREAERILGEVEADQHEAEDTERLLRGRINVDATVDVQYQDSLSNEGSYEVARGIPPQQLQVLRRAKVPESEIASMGPERAKELTRKIMIRYKQKLSTYGQCKALMRSGYSKAEAVKMSANEASAALDALSKNGWKRQAISA